MTVPSIDAFFRGRGDSRRLLEAVAREVDRLGGATVRVSRSQIAFRRKRNFALVWVPGKWLTDRPTAPLVLTVSFPKRDPSRRWKEINEVAPKRLTHHLELFRESDVDEEVGRWLQAAWERAA